MLGAVRGPLCSWLVSSGVPGRSPAPGPCCVPGVPLLQSRMAIKWLLLGLAQELFYPKLLQESTQNPNPVL